MTRGSLLACAAVAALVFGQPARANTAYTFGFHGAGISGVATVTVEPNVPPATDPNPNCGQTGQNACRHDPPGTLADPTLRVTGITGTFSDANIGIFNASIKSLVPISPANERDTIFDPAVPASLSFIDYMNEPTIHDAFSYDNLFYPGGNPVVCDFPFIGTFLDPFGVAFTIAGGDTVDLWGDGNFLGGPLTNGAAVTDGINRLDYNFAGVSAAIPEPSTWGMLLLGFAGLGFAGKSRKVVSIAA
jgi:hypothetical protein